MASKGFKIGDKVRCRPAPNRDSVGAGIVTQIDRGDDRPIQVEFNDGRWYSPWRAWFAEAELMPADAPPDERFIADTMADAIEFVQEAVRLLRKAHAGIEHIAALNGNAEHTKVWADLWSAMERIQTGIYKA